MRTSTPFVRSGLLLAVVLVAGTGNALAEEQAKVLSAQPVVHQFQVPQQVCGDTPVAVTEPNSGAGAVMGAIAGGAIGNAVGAGAGRAVATAAGLVGGAVVGDKIEGQKTTVQQATTCTTQMVMQNVTVYHVTYEYAGKQYSVELPNDPGKTLAVSVTPAAPPLPDGAGAATGTAPVMVAPVVGTPVPVPVYATPYGYPYPYPYYYGGYYPYPVVGVRFGFGYHRGFRH